MIDISDLSDNLELKDGIWYSKTKSDISYPDTGNDLCYQIEEESFWFKHRNKLIVEVVRNFPPPGEILDIGGGNGYVAAELHKNGFNTILVEPGTSGVKNARRRSISNIICSSLDDADFKKKSLPSIGLFDVIEHIEDDISFLINVRRVLCDNGMLYITVPAYNFLWATEDKISGHYRRYSQKSVSHLLKASGFKIIYSTYFFFLLVLPILFLKSIPSTLGLKNDKKVLERMTCDHKHSSRIFDTLVENVLCSELSRIKLKKTIPFGSSIIIAAIKV